MSVQKTNQKQYQGIVGHAALQLTDFRVPTEGWVATVRKALGMSGAQLARRLGVSRASVSQTEKKELSGSVTIKHMQNMAEALGCRFVYAIVPEGRIEDVIRDQATHKASKLVQRVSGHMALEKQSLPPEKARQEIEWLRDQLIRDMPRYFWENR